jgi:hypothetical protein
MDNLKFDSSYTAPEDGSEEPASEEGIELQEQNGAEAEEQEQVASFHNKADQTTKLAGSDGAYAALEEEEGRGRRGSSLGGGQPQQTVGSKPIESLDFDQYESFVSVHTTRN